MRVVAQPQDNQSYVSLFGDAYKSLPHNVLYFSSP